MLLPRVLLVPHLPTLLVDEHRGHRTAMLEALADEADWFAGHKPAVVVVLSGRWESDGPFCVDTGRRHRTLTDYSGFGVEVRYDCPGQPALARALVEAGARADVHVGAAQRGVDSGVTVPLHFLFPRPAMAVVPLSVARRPVDECRAWGAVIRRVLDARPEPIAFLVGGMLSHARHDWQLGREVPEARELDERVLGALAKGSWGDLHPTEARLVERAQPEAELRHLEILRGVLGRDVAGVLRCYEPGPGVGAALIEFELPVAEGASARA
jgi:aromatic ring-opening dioxygenase catalytic subunit (LigB family)